MIYFISLSLDKKVLIKLTRHVTVPCEFHGKPCIQHGGDTLPESGVVGNCSCSFHGPDF